MSTKSDLAVERFGEIFELNAGETLRPGDRIINKGTDVATVGTVSKSAEHPSLVATLKPGQSVRVTDVGRPDEAVLGLEAGDAETFVVSATSEAAAAADFAVDPEVELLEEAQGLFGAVPFMAGAGGLAAAAGAIGLASLATGNDSDETGADGEPTPVGTAATAGGLAGGISQLNDGLQETPLAPVTALTGALADGLATLGQALGNAGDPTGLAGTLGEIIGTPGSGAGEGTTSPSGNAGEAGLVGLLNTVSSSLDNAVASGPLQPLAQVVDPVSQLLGSTGGQVDGLAQGLANVGSTLIGDNSVLAPLTSDVLGPIVGSSTGQDGGLPQTLNQLAEGLTDLTNANSALAPLNVLTEPVSDAVLSQLAAGLQTIGDGIGGFAAQDPSGVSGLLANLLGSTADAAGSASVDPLSALTGLLGDGLTGGLMSGLPGADALTGGLPGVDALTGALPGADALTGGLPGADALGGLLGGLPLSMDALPMAGAGDLLAAGDGLSGISSGAGLPGLDVLTSLLPL